MSVCLCVCVCVRACAPVCVSVSVFISTYCIPNYYTKVRTFLECEILTGPHNFKGLSMAAKGRV